MVEPSYGGSRPRVCTGRFSCDGQADSETDGGIDLKPERWTLGHPPLGAPPSDMIVNSYSPALLATDLQRRLQDASELLDLAIELLTTGQQQAAQELVRATYQELGKVVIALR